MGSPRLERGTMRNFDSLSQEERMALSLREDAEIDAKNARNRTPKTPRPANWDATIWDSARRWHAAQDQALDAQECAEKVEA